MSEADKEILVPQLQENATLPENVPSALPTALPSSVTEWLETARQSLVILREVFFSNESICLLN